MVPLEAALLRACAPASRLATVKRDDRTAIVGIWARNEQGNSSKGMTEGEARQE